MKKINLRVAMFQPDIAQNTGAMMRLCACFGVGLDIIEPCGFLFDDEKMKRVGMDYIDITDYERHFSWDHFLQARKNNRLILLSTKADSNYTDFSFQDGDILVLGRESCGVPDQVRDRCDDMIKIEMSENARSLNVTITGAIVMGEAIRQIKNLS